MTGYCFRNVAHQITFEDPCQKLYTVSLCSFVVMQNVSFYVNVECKEISFTSLLCSNLAQSTAAKFHELYRQALNPSLCRWSSTVIQADAIKKCLFMRRLTSKTFYQTNCASVTRLPPFPHVSAILTPSKLFSSESFLATGSFICQNWINIVDGTNIVNLPEEWSWLNSISADNTGGKCTQRQCYFAESLLFWRGYWSWQKGDAEFALINAKVPLQSWSGVFLELVFLPSDTYLAYSLNTVGKLLLHRLQSHQCTIFRQLSSWLFPSSWLIAFVKAILLVYVPTLTLSSNFFWLDALNVYCVNCCICN